MRAIVESVDGDGAPPPELSLQWQCERYRAMPDAGGMFAQDYGLMQRMAALSNIHNALTKLRNARGEQIHALTEFERRVLRLLMDNGLI